MISLRLLSRRGSTIACGAAMLVATTFLAASARAEPPSFAERHPDLTSPDVATETRKETEARKEKAREAFKIGVREFKAEKWEECEAATARAWVLQRSAGTAGNLGFCEMELGYYVDAREHFEFALAAYDPAGKSERDVEQFKKRIAAAKARAEGWLGSFRIDNVPAGATVSIGPKRTLTAPFDAVFLYPGTYVVEVRKDGELLYSEIAVVSVGTKYSTVFRPPPPKPNVLPRTDPRPSLSLLVAGGATALSFAALGGVFLGVSHARLGEVQDLRAQIAQTFGDSQGACYEPAGVLFAKCARLAGLTSDAALFNDLGLAAISTASVVGLGTIAYGLWPRSARVTAQPAAGGLLPWKTTAFVGPSGAFLSLEGTW